MRKTIEYPQFVFSGITPNHRATPLDKNLRIFGGDSETFEGEPMTIQAHDGTDTLFEYVNGRTIFKTFMPWLFDRARDRGVNICYFHFLRFDIPIVFYEKRLAIYEQISEIKFDLHGYECELLFGKINKATIRKSGRIVHLFDSWSFTQASLERSLKMMKIDASKLKKPARLGKVDYSKMAPDDPERLEFEAYANVDASSEYKLGVKIIDYHREYQVRPSISLPQFAARVFRHHFMKADESIPFPPPKVVKAAELSYHGGLNYAPDDCPIVVEDAYEADISSAYPYAMTQIPQMIKGDYAQVRKYEPNCPGVYRISGVDRGRYPLVFDHDFKAVRGRFENIWITSYELAHCLENPDVAVEVHEGYVWNADPGYEHNPLKEYVEHFYQLKETTDKDDPNYYFYKIALNGLYGKFLQTTEIRELEALEEKLDEPKAVKGKRHAVPTDYEWDDVLGKFVKVKKFFRAGGLYNPFIATLITGYVRAMLYELERDNDAFHAATDAVKTTKFIPKVPGLGGLKIETFGRCYVFRNKLYLHFARSTKYCGHDPEKTEDGKKINAWRYGDYFKEEGQHLCKFGLHGFKGKVGDLFAARHALLKGESFDYEYGHMVGLREGFRRREKICSYVPRKERFKLTPKLIVAAV